MILTNGITESATDRSRQIIAIIAGVIGGHLSDDDDQGGYWPKDPNSSGSTSG